MNRFQRIALVAFVCVELLIFVGAVVRVTGSGLGCPDWPLCYGRMTPPSSVEEIDFALLDLTKFRAKAARLGRDPASITEASLRAEYDPRATWIEYLNRLTSLPVGLSVLALFIASIGQWRRGRGEVCFASFAAVVLVGINAWLGRQVVLSGLRPGTITLHMALAILLLAVLVYIAWRGCERPWKLQRKFGGGYGRMLGWLGIGLFVLVVGEGLMGSQVRELTDELARSHAGQARSLWIAELEQAPIYLVHRSFSWLVVAAALAFAWRAHRVQANGVGWLESAIVCLVLAQLVLGVVLAHIGIVPMAQVLHIGLSSLLVSGLVLWILGYVRLMRS